MSRLIVDYEHQRIVGHISLHAGAVDPEIITIGLAIAPVYRRLGYGKAALRILTDHAHSSKTACTLQAVTAPSNTAGYHLARSAGLINTTPPGQAGNHLWIYESDQTGG